MTTAIDSSVLLAIFNAEAGADRWMETLIHSRKQGRLILCEIVYAEVAAGFETQRALDEQLDSMGIFITPLNERAAWTAGRTFRRYRESGGPRQHLIPDFLIAAHALEQADRLAAIDRGYLRRWFSQLTVLAC